MRRAAQILREEGLLTLWFRFLGETVYRRMLVLERSLEEPVPAVEPRRKVSLRWLRPEEAAACAAFYGVVSEAEVSRRLAQGHRCLIAEADGRVVHAWWAASSAAWIDYLQMELPLAPGEVYLYQAYTAPEWRGLNLATAGLAAVLRCLREEGFLRARCCLQPDRTEAYPPPLKVGFVPAAWLGWFGLGRWRRVFRRPARGLPRWGRRALGTGARYWDVVGRRHSAKPTMDQFMGAMKRRAHLGLIRRWGGVPEQGWVLKTDVFEEADGAGRLLGVLRREDNHVLGMDISPVICRRAAARDNNRGCYYTAADVRRLPFADGSFALIVSTSTLDHFLTLEDFRVSLRELRRVLGAGGRLIVTVDNRRNISYPLLEVANRLGLTPYLLGRAFTLRELERELRLAGFEVRDTATILHGPRLVPYLSVRLSGALKWRWLRRWVHRALLRMQRLEWTRWQYLTGSFVAALAEAPK